jgi:hypothetical protein
MGIGIFVHVPWSCATQNDGKVVCWFVDALSSDRSTVVDVGCPQLPVHQHLLRLSSHQTVVCPCGCASYKLSVQPMLMAVKDVGAVDRRFAIIAISRCTGWCTQVSYWCHCF